jgi:hypothetical protein
MPNVHVILETEVELAYHGIHGSPILDHLCDEGGDLLNDIN